MNVIGYRSCRLFNNYWKVHSLSRNCESIVNQHEYSTVIFNKCNLKTNQVQSNAFNQCNFVNTKVVSVNEDNNGFFKSFIKKVGWLPHNKTKIRLKGYMLYESVVDQLNYEEWMTHFNLDNTFTSWFMITEIHVWLLLVRCMEEGDTGRQIRNAIIEAMWADVSVRATKLVPGNKSLVRKHINLLSEQFQAALISYDEGIVSHDTVLAGALWRRFFQMTCDDPIVVEHLIKYVRKQLSLLERIPSTEFMESPKINWQSLKENK